MAHGNDCSHALGLGIELGMPQQATDKAGNFMLPDSQSHDAVMGMRHVSREETQIACEKCRAAQTMQQGYNFVLQSLAPDSVPNLANRDMPRAQQPALALNDVFIENVHAATGSSASSS